MKKNTFLKIATASAIALTVSTVTINIQKNKNITKTQSPFDNLKALSVSLNKAYATTVASYHTTIYGAAKREINTEVKNVVDAINSLLSSANITSCTGIPVVSTTAFYDSGTYKLYASTIGSHTTFPLSSITGITYTNKLELKLASNGTTLGALYVDCNTGAAEVRYLGKLDTPRSGDTNLAIAYYKNPTTQLQTILLASDYNATTDYVAGKLAAHYTEGTTSSTIVYGYAENSTTGYTGTLTGDTTGTVTAATDGDVTTGAAKNDLTTISGATAYSVSAINSMTISL